jgi:hypothetical protein
MKTALPLLLLTCLALPLLAQEASWPAPPAGWWEPLIEKHQATYTIREGSLVLHRTIAAEANEEGLLTIGVTLQLGEKKLPKRTRTVDPRQEDFFEPLAGAQLRQLRQETLELAGRAWNCEVWELSWGDETLTAWRCASLPPVFAGGNVKLERRRGEETCVVELEAYQLP